MGREIAEAVPEARDVFRRASEASGLDLERLCFEPSRKLVETEVQQPALVATSLAMLAAVRAAESSRTTSSAIRSASSPRSRPRRRSASRTIALVRERGLAMAEAARQHPGSMAAILGLEDGVVETLCRKILGVWPANYNCPGQVVVSGEHSAVDECCVEAQRERATDGQARVSGAFHGRSSHAPPIASAESRRVGSPSRPRRSCRQSPRRSKAPSG